MYIVLIIYVFYAFGMNDSLMPIKLWIKILKCTLLIFPFNLQKHLFTEIVYMVIFPHTLNDEIMEAFEYIKVNIHE